VPRRTLGQEVAERLHADLLGGEYKEGERIPSERELMSRYSAGRNTVREAVQRLAALGMLEVKAGSGTTVTRADGRHVIARNVRERALDDAAIGDLVEFRLLLEAEAAALASRRAGDDDLAAIREALAAYQGAVRRSEDVYEHDLEFHRTISAASHNAIYLQVIDTSAQMFQRSMRASDRAPGDVSTAATEHALIAHHILSGDSRAARETMRAHILASDRRRRGGATATG